MDNHPNANRQIINCHGERTYRSSSRHACENNSDACEDNTTNCTAGGNDRYFSLSHDTTSSTNRRHYSITRAKSYAAIDGYTKSCSSSDDGAAIGQKRGISDDATHEEARQHSLLPPPHTGINNKKLKLCKPDRKGILLIWGRLLALPTVRQFMDGLKQYSIYSIKEIGCELDCYDGFNGGYGQEEGESPEDDLRRTLKQLYLDHRYQELAKSITPDNERFVLPHILSRLCSYQSNPDLSLISSIVQSCSRFNTPKDNAGVDKLRRRNKGEENDQRPPTQSASIGKCLVCVMLLYTIIFSHLIILYALLCHMI